MDKRPSVLKSHRNLVEDFERRRFSQLMFVVIVGICVVVSVTLFQGSFTNFLIGTAAIATFYFLRNFGLTRNIKLAIIASITIGIALIVTATLKNSGINDATILAFFIPLSFAAILGNNRIFGYTVSGIFAALVTIYISSEFNLIELNVKTNATHKLIIVMGFFGVMSAVMWRISRDVKSALNVSANEMMKGGQDSVFGYNKSITDPLTKLLNLHGIEENFTNASQIATLREKKLALLRVYFSSINQSLFLQDVIFREKFTIEIASILKKLFRGIDLIANIGYHDFVIVIYEYNNSDEYDVANILSQKIIEKFRQGVNIDGFNIQINCNIGIAICESNLETFDGILRNSEMALSFAKETGPNVSAIHNRDMIDRVQAQSNELKKLRNAITQRKFRVVYQTRHNLQTNAVIGVEALVRWIDDEDVVILPQDYFALAEMSGLVAQIDKYVIQEVANDLKTWRAQHQNFVNVSINISDVFLRMCDFEPYLFDTLSKYDVPAKCISLEVSSKLVVPENEKHLDVLRKLSAMGFGINVDDSGKGHASMQDLYSMEVNALSIGSEFVSNLLDSAEAMEIVRSFIQISKLKGIKIIAKGIESKEVVKKLIEMECECGQGWHWNKSLKAEQAFQMCE